MPDGTKIVPLPNGKYRAFYKDWCTQRMSVAGDFSTYADAVEAAKGSLERSQRAWSQRRIDRK